MIDIRHFTHDDAGFIQQDLYSDLSRSEIIELIDEWNTCVYQGRYFGMFAVLFDGEPVGCVSLVEHSKHVASLGAEVIPEARRKGVAYAAVSRLMQYASEKDYRILLDQVRRDNAASIRLHEKLGFESDGYVYRNQRDHEVVLYLRQV